MPLDKGKLQKLYSTLQQGGYSQSYDEFEKGFTGNDNYPNRKKVYDLLTEHGADIGKTYEDFMGKMQAPSQPSQPQQRTQAPAPAPKPQPKPRPKPKAKGGGMTAAQRAAFIKSAQDIVHHSAAGLQRVKNQMDYANGNRGLKVRPVHLGQNSKVVRRHVNGTVAKPRPVFDVAPEQQPGDTYLTESGNEYGSRAEADTEQNAVDQYRYDQSETGQLNNAYAEAERLDKLLEQRGKELDAENEGKWWRDMPRGGGGAVSTMNANDNNGRMTDTEYLNLLAARKKVDEQIRDLKAARDEKTGTFLGGLWRGFRDYAFDLSNWDNGYRDLLTTSAMLRAKTGAAQTPREKASERMMMEDTYKAGEAAQKAEKVLGNGYRFMRIGAQSLPFALQFMAGNAMGMTGGIARAGEGMGVKLARKIAIKQGANNMMRNIGRSVLKNTGVALGDLGAATALTTTIQAGQTGADIGKRYVGDVAYDPKTDDYKLEGGKSLGRSIYEGVANSAIENYTEMLGEHMHLGKFASSALTKVGLGRVSNWFTKVGKTDFMKGVNKYLGMAGFNGYPQEVMEEEVGIPLHAIFDGGNKMSDLLDGRQQLDIVGGMLFSMAGMGGASMAMQGGHKAAMAVQYHQDQHKLDNADKVASFRLTSDKWAPIKEEIDGTTNEDFGKTMKNVLSNDELSDQEKQAVWDYAQRLIIMRGHNMGQEAATRNGMTDKETNTANESYTEGYNTTDATAMNDAKNRLAAAQQKLDGIFGENTNAQQILDAKKEDGSPYFTANDRKAAQAVVNAQQEYEGMMQRVRDDIDDEVQQTGAIYDSRTNDKGVIQSATLKAQNPDGTDRKVYITSGNVVMTDDGKSVDREKSDMSIVVVDDEGKVQMISPEDIFSLDTPIDGAQAKQQAIDAIQQSKAQEAADKINGKVNLAAGNTYTLTDSTGQQIEATIVADGQTGAVQNPDGTVNVSMNGKVVPMDLNTLQQMVDNTNMQRAAQGDEEDTTGDAAAMQQPTEPGNTEQTDDEGGTVTPEGAAVPTYPGGVVAPDVQAPHEWQVDDTFTIDNGGMPVRGQVTGIDADGVEIYTESPVNGKKMQVVSPEELQSMTTEINGETVQGQEDAAAMQQPTQPVDGEQTGDNGSNGVNGEQPQGQAEPLSSQAEPQQTEGQQPQRAIDRIPSQQVDDGKGNVRTVHNWEQAEPGDTYDALTEIYHGNADRVKKGVQNRIGAIDKQIKSTQKQMDAIDNSDDFDAVAAQGEQYDQLQKQKEALEQQRKYWQSVQGVPQQRKLDEDKRTEEEKAAAKAAQEKAEAEAAEKARQEREQVNGVPDVVNDIPADARKRGFRNVNGMVVNRQGETEGVTGRESNVKFSSTDTAKGHIKVIDADQLQPSHVSGQRNPSFFIDEAQPKDRTDTVSSMAAAKIASNLNPEEITGDGSAYQFSAPTVNSRGEVIQGNNRSDALKLMYSTPAFKPAQDAYKQYISDHAEEFGFTPEDVAKIQQMQHPVMVNELGVDDDEAIRLGQMKASDNESGGIERIDPVTTSQKLGGKVSNFANVLLSSPDEDASLSDVLMQNGAKAVKWLRTQGAISDTAAQSAFDRKGNLTPEARMDLLNILKQSLFQGGVSDLPAMFDKMPAKAQKAILNTFMRDFDSAESERILPEIQKAIEAWYGCAMSNEAFAKAPNYKSAKAAMHDWTLQTNLLDDNMPSDKFSNFAMELACRLQGCSMRETQQSLNDFFDLVQGKSQGDLFGGTTMGEQTDRQEAIKRIFNIEYKSIKNKNNGKNGSNAVADDNSQSGEGRPGSTRDGAGRERAAGAGQHADVAGGTEGNDEKGINAGAIRTKDGGYKKLPTGYAYRITDAQEVKDVIDNGMFRKMPDDMIVPGSNKVYTSKSGRKFSFGKQAGNTHGGKAFAAGMPWGDNGNGGTTSGGSGEKYFIAIPGNNIDGWRVGHHGHYSEPRPFDEIEEGKGLWLPFDEDGDVADLSTDGMRVFKKVGDTYYEVVHPEDIANNTTKQTAQPIGSTSSQEHVKTERQSVNTEPTEKQKEAGNYKKGHIKVDGFDITIENPKGSTRSGTDASGKVWSVPMHYDYGYIKGTEGVDGDHIDVYLSDEPTKGNVYVIDQVDQKDGTFDEHKAMYGFPSMEAAIDAYKGQYEDGWKVGTVTEVSREDFKKWVESSKRKTKPFADYKSMDAAAKQQRTEPSAHTGTNRVNVSQGVNGTDDSTLNGIQENGSKVEGITDGEPSADELSQLSDVLDRTNKVVQDDIFSGNGNDESWKSYFHAKNAFGRAARRLSVKRLSELVDGKRHEDWYDRLSDVSKDVLRDVSKRNSSMADNDRAFDEVKAAQPPIAPVDPPKRISAMDFAGKDKSGNQAYNGVVYHDGGYVIGTDGHVLFAQHTSYPKELEGKTTDKKGNVTDSGYPKWRSVIPDMDSSEELGIDTSALHRFVCGVLKRDKKAMIAVRDRAGHISIYKAKDLDMFLRAAGSCNADVRLVSLEPLLDYDVDNYEFVFSNDKGTGLITSFATDDIRHMKALYTFDGAKADGSKTQKNVDEVLDEVERRKRSGIPEAESKRKQFDPSVRKDLERFVGEAKGKGITIDWEHSEPENAYIPMKIAGKASFVGVTEQDSDTPMTFPSDRPIAIYDIAEGGDIPDATKIDKFEAYVKEYNSSKSLIEGSDDYASMDDQYPYVSFKSVDAAAKFNDWLNAEGRHSDGSNVDMADSLLDEVAARNDISEHATMTAEELKGREVEELRTLEKKEHAQADTDEQLAKIAKGEKRDKLLNDVKAHRANAELAKRVREEKEKEAEDIWGFRRASSRVGRLTKREIALRDALNDAVRETGIEVIEDVEEGQRVLDMANDALLSKSKKRALETASLGTSPRSLTAIPSADGAKVLNNLDNLVKEYENFATQPKTFVGQVADALGIPREKFKDKSSRYATFETKNGKIVTIRISDHNATASNLDVNGQEDAISVVVTNKPNTGITNDGDAHIVEYYYNAIKLRKAEGKPLADIVRSIKQALYSGEFNDTTGLAERQEVNIPAKVRKMMVYHGSGNDFDMFQTMRHLGEGEGNQAFGVGTYVTDQMDLGKKYAYVGFERQRHRVTEGTLDGKPINWNHPDTPGYVFVAFDNVSKYGKEEALKSLKQNIVDYESLSKLNPDNKSWQEHLEESKKAYDLVSGCHMTIKLPNGNHAPILYTVNIPDDNGHNYLDWDKAIDEDATREIVDTLYSKLLKSDKAQYLYRTKENKAKLLANLNQGIYGRRKFGDVYLFVSSELESDKAASEFLHDLGYTGIKVHASHNSNDARYKDNWNYIIFNDKDLKIKDKVRFFRTANGDAYGYTVGGKIYIDPRIATSETPIHEYAHLWAEALRKANPKEWQNVVELMKDCKAVWEQVKKEYPELKTDDEIADEVLAHYSGKRGAERARKAMEDSMNGKDDLKTAAKKGLMRLKEALSKFWKNVCDLLHVHFTSAEEVADRVMYDMLRGFKSDNIDRGYREDRDYSKEEDSQKDAVVRYRLADPDESAVLDDQPTVKVYRAMQLIDGKLYPPMAAKVNGSLVEPAEPGQWLRADEHPELAKNGLFTLNKGGKDASGKRLGSVPAAYNPYWHTSRSPLNDQFSSAYKRPNLVTVEVEIPKSELTSGYHADGAKDPVGEMSWHAGPVSSKLPKEKERKVILSRWCKVVRVVPDAEVADKVAGMLKGENISVPDNTITPSLRRELEKRGVPITHTKMVEDWERKYPSAQSGLSREGNGAYSDDELSMINDPFVKMLGEKARTAKQRKAFAARERRSMAAAVKELAEKLHLDNVEIRSAAQQLTEQATKQERRKARAKGYYDRKSGTIVINIDNHRDVEDAVQTLLHEAVAHYGLRQLFGSHFDTFLDNVYKAADMDVRQRITDLALRKYKGDFHVATEEYLASLAENTNFEHMPDSFWSKIKTLFLKMLHSIGFDGFAGMGVTLSDNELRYILWRSYENLKEPGRYRSILGEAEDVAKQAELKVGNYGVTSGEPRRKERGNVAESSLNGVSEPEAWGKNDLLSKAEQVSHGMDPGLLFRDTIEDDDYTARETYNRMADEKKNIVREAWQDSMINVRNLQEAVLKQRGEKMEDWEDAYNEENRSHGKSRAESEYFTDNLYKPLLKAVNAVAKAAKVSVGDVTEYMMAKHGLERNVVFASRDAQKAYDKAQQKAQEEYDALMNAAQAESDPKKKDALEKRAQKVKFPDYNDLYLHFRQRDYSGLTALTGQSDAQDAEVEAQRIVTDMESKAAVNGGAQNGLIDELWKATNAATEWTLRKAYESGMMSRDNYDYVRSMFNNYIPLRGWEEDTAGDLYDYVGSGDKGTAFSPTLHKAKGRRSQADNPIAYIGSMAVSAIVQGNKNKVKQTFMRFAENHPTNLVTVSEMWYRNYGTDTAPDWREDVPYIPEDATADEIAAIVKQHEDDMEQLEAQGMATKQRGRLHLGVPVKKGQALEHHVEVMVNGKKYVLYINGNPRAAQALNGTRMRRSSERSFESSKIATIGRKLSELYTSLSPSFTVSNMFRDLTMAAISTAIKENPAYALRFRLNVARLGGPARMFTLMRWYKKAAAQQLPTGQMSGIKRYFYEFMTQGAETGFTSLKEIDTYKDDMQKMYKHMNQSMANPKRLLRGLSEGLEYTNRCIEDMTRFATYMTSRQSGRSVRESVSDAKTITLNFNRKGSGELGNSTYRNLQIFVNPAIQSLQNVASMAMDHPVKFSLYTGMVALIGAAQVFATQLLWSMFGGGDGDDDNWNAVDEYWKLPTWQRRNNLVMWIPGTKKFAMIPLAQEFRVFHGFGETLTTTLQGKSDESPALELMSQTADLLPLDFAGNNGNMLVNLAPTVVQPLLQVRFNTDFTGRPLYKDTGFNKYEPSFQKAYVGTPSWLVKSSEFLNDLTGGDAHKQGWWERTNIGQYANNPAVVDHLLKGYLGGMYSFFAQTGGAMLTAASGKLPDVQEVPVANRVVTAVRETEQSGKQKLPDWYYDLSEENARHQNEFSGYKKDYMTGDADGKKKFNALIKSKDFAKWQEVNTYIGAVQQIRTAMSYTKDPAEKAELQKNLDEVLVELKKLKDK